MGDAPVRGAIPGTPSMARIATLLHEMAAARRSLVRRPGPALLSILTIALAVTATSTLASVTWSVLVRPLPWPGADRLIRVWETRGGGTPRLNHVLTSATLDAWRDAATTMTETAWYRESVRTIAGPDGAERIAAADVSTNLLTMLGAAPALGRTLRDGDVDAAVVSEPFARRQFGDDATWIGRALTLDGRSYTVVGVVPAGFGFPSPETNVWVPMTQILGLNTFQVVGRLATSATPEQAAVEVEARARQAPPIEPAVQTMLFGASGPPQVHAARLLDVETGRVRPALLAMLAATALLLATALVSLVGLQLARATERRQELAIRAAIGASRVRLAALLMGETLWLSLAGGVVALVLTRWILGLAPNLLPPDFPRITTLSFNALSFLAVATTAALAGVLAGFLPSWQAVRVNLAASITDESRAAPAFGARSATNRSRRLLLATQMAVAVVLLVGAGLVCRTLLEMVREDLGYAPADLVIARLIGTNATVRRGSGGRVDADTLQRLLTRLGQIPGVTGVALSTALPFQSDSGRMAIGDTLPAPDGSGREAPATWSENEITPSYFDLVGMRVVAGRALDEHDYSRATRAIVVNEAFARAYLGERPLGRLLLGGEIVGIVADIKDRGPRDAVDPQVFYLYDTGDGALLVRPATILLRTSNPDAVVPTARGVVRGVDNRLGLDGVTTIQARLSAMIAEPRLYATVATAAAAFALLVSAVGLFGVLWHSVAGRTREIGVRTALGATPSRIAGLVLREGLAVAAAGTAAGLVAAGLLVRYLSSLLYHVAPHDAIVFIAAPAVLMGIAASACLIPARRAARVDPIDALKTV